MRNVVAYLLVSLDGVAEAPDQFVLDFDEVMYANLGRVIETQDAVLLGRRSYDEWAPFWPTSSHEPFASFINAVDKYVVTSTPLEHDWASTTVVDGSVEDFVRDLKQQPGGDIGVHGSLALTSSLLAAQLVDRLRLVVAPVSVGEGRRFWDGPGDARRWELERVVGTPTGSLLADYRAEPSS
ncbi:dihydrofolate reductase [Mumia zhuanghuii]|uniref:Dihydrofolate reductase family protein n=2 Tax=Mumia TaxID=1546255 RepID=A0ABW1QNU2_9ACTN|nr:MULTISPECIES: dihydrofolate reductase family protein [Mumia]KAA1423896.1 dihydrofolate reductase [Mumia zhuanghuii]